MRNVLIFFVCVLFSFVASGQGSYDIGIIPEVNLTTKFNPTWSLDVEIAPRFETIEGTFRGETESELYFSLLDITAVVATTINVDRKLGFGYLSRFRSGEIIHRLIQQLSFTNPHYGFRIGHRFRTDQTFTPNKKVRYRARYRVSSDISLNGEFIDAGEFYIKIGNEYVGSLEEEEIDIEIRLVPVLGYYLNDNNKLELGLDYRVDSFINGGATHRFWLNAAYYLSF